MIKKLVLDKVRWARGDTPTIQLLNDAGKMCCLGYCLGQEGMPARYLLNVGEPEEAYAYGDYDIDDDVVEYLVEKRIETEEDEDSGEESEIVKFIDKGIVSNAIGINDAGDTTDEQKVEALNEIFSKVGIEVVLVDTPEEAAALGGLPVDYAAIGVNC